MIKQLLIVAIGGGTGSMLRFIIQKILQPQHAAAFPTGTFLINLTGCFLIGVLWNLAGRWLQWNEELRLLLMTGLCGGFTTFSAFTLESIGLLKENKTSLFLIYITASVFGGLLATWIGFRISK
jgi:CrcB protein